MNIRTKALQGLGKAHGAVDGIVCTSKFYVPQKSRTRKSAWWIEVDKSKVSMSPSSMVYLVCEKAPEEEDFHYLRLPGSYLLENQDKLDIRRDKNKFSMFLSAEQENLFQDERGDGKVSFSQFLV
jgi:hypothetical protein